MRGQLATYQSEYSMLCAFTHSPQSRPEMREVQAHFRLLLRLHAVFQLADNPPLCDDITVDTFDFFLCHFGNGLAGVGKLSATAHAPGKCGQ
jgi:hypothetical protein